MLDFSVSELPDGIKKSIKRYFDMGLISIVSTEEESPQAIDEFALSNQLRNTVSYNESIAIYMAKKLGCGIIAIEPAVIRLLEKLGFEILSILPPDVLIRGDTFYSISSNEKQYWQQTVRPQWTTSSTDNLLVAPLSSIGKDITSEASDVYPRAPVV